jgi:hypothetical protein
MLAIENAEIGGTLIALSIPGLKPLFDRFFFKVIHRSQAPSFNVLDPSAVFASEASKHTVTVGDLTLSNPWMMALGAADYGRYEANVETTMMAHEDADSTNPPHPWRESLTGFGFVVPKA